MYKIQMIYMCSVGSWEQFIIINNAMLSNLHVSINFWNLIQKLLSTFVSMTVEFSQTAHRYHYDYVKYRVASLQLEIMDELKLSRI